MSTAILSAWIHKNFVNPYEILDGGSGAYKEQIISLWVIKWAYVLF